MMGKGDTELEPGNLQKEREVKAEGRSRTILCKTISAGREDGCSG